MHYTTEDDSDWLQQQLDTEGVLLVGGPLDGSTHEATPDAGGPFRLDVPGKGVAQYQRIARRTDGVARARFIGYE